MDEHDIAATRRRFTEGWAGATSLAGELFAADLVTNGVAVQVRWRGTHLGVYGNVQPTGLRVDVRTLAVWRFRDGRVVEISTLQDQLGLLQQVGLTAPDLYAAQVPVGVA